MAINYDRDFPSYPNSHHHKINIHPNFFSQYCTHCQIMSYPRQENVTLIKSEDLDIFQAISSNNPSRCKELIHLNTDCVNECGWNKLTPLHNACLSGLQEIVKLLIEHGADPNALSSFEETPLHYACRRGNLPIVHFLFQNGADPAAKDKRGRTCMHFAATGGSVLMLHYLGMQTNLKFDAPDFTGKNILSICCEQRHTVAANYLLCEGRVSPKLSDSNGVTPLHIAAEKGYGELAWTILTTGGLGLLHLQNKKGQTPCHIAKAGKSVNHKQLFNVMKSYLGKEPDSFPRGPRILWYTHLLLPFTVAGVIFLLSSMLNGHSSYFSIIMFTLLAFYIARQSHRIRHISRWPNPIFMGGFVGGVVHCSYAQVYKILPALWPCPWLTIWSGLLIGAGAYLLWYLISKDPGIDRHQKVNPVSGDPLSVMDVAEGKCRDLDFCVFTQKIYGDKTKYCRLCEKPILLMDHHCLFLNNCVAWKNHREFILLLLVVMVLQFSFLCSVGLLLSQLISSRDIFEDGFGDPLTPYAVNLFYLEPWLFALSGLCTLSFIWETTLVLAQLSVIARGNTTYFSSKEQAWPRPALTRKQMLKNLVIFFLRPKKVNIESNRV